MSRFSRVNAFPFVAIVQSSLDGFTLLRYRRGSPPECPDPKQVAPLPHSRSPVRNALDGYILDENGAIIKGNHPVTQVKDDFPWNITRLAALLRCITTRIA